ncbi:hypothetical protein [Saccharopolyspora gregorii]|uniref:hypothetical protein n=1 Tax=Saccharopolyspora gregorii TaxID=33914 RepID=UPI0021ABF7CF|nr:hypothetical protein [Saccharopolyspora gregorii]
MPDGFYTDSQGRIRPINGKKGRGGFVAAAGATALAVTAVAGGGGATGGVSSVAGEQVAVRVSNAKQAARNGQSDKVWQRMRLRVREQRSPDHQLDCIVHSFGQVQEFFVGHRCRSLTRTVIPLADEQGGTAVVSIAWVRTGSTRDARALNRLDRRDGTGDIRALGSSVLAARGVSFTGEHYESTAKGTLFVRAEAAPMSGNLPPALLDGMAEVAVLLPRP